ncbi:hypothetical protein L6164_016344 [Bauhinia variegata]|uniref:Uncharacterized protein n=1 Tax=Bauhinia variegata TaxID=167791 RepID=A0ACB9NU82_BAUVA|nr:hypothetical protein L6164_016344 [Bauhinia variegata]
MASAEARASYTANRSFTQDFRMPPNSSGHPSSTSEDLGSYSVPSNPVSVDSSCMPHSSNMKWWLHVKTNMANEPNYTRKHLNSWEAELGAFCGEFVDDNAKIGGDQSVKTFDAFSCIGSADSAVKHQWRVSQTCMRNDTDTEMSKLEAALNYDSQKTYKKKDEGELLFSDGHLMEWDTANFLASERCKTKSSDLESDWIGTEKAGPWWHTAGKDGLASFVAQRSREHMENCDLPRPQVKLFRKNPSVSPKCVDHDKALPASANPTAALSISHADSSYTYGTTTTSGCSFQDSDTTFSQSQDSDPITKDGRLNSKNNTTSELLEALCHSQTRAREAENAAQQAYNEKEHILSLFFRQASQLFAYKQWLQLLQLENLCLQLRNKNQPLLNLLSAAHRGKELSKSHCRAARRKKKNSKRRHGIRKCAFAFAVGLGLAGAGLLLGWTMGWMFPIYR